jgi:hypothetical protein
MSCKFSDDCSDCLKTGTETCYEEEIFDTPENELYDVEWIEDEINKQKTGLSNDEAVSLASKIALRGIVATISVR